MAPCWVATDSRAQAQLPSACVAASNPACVHLLNLCLELLLLLDVVLLLSLVCLRHGLQPFELQDKKRRRGV